MKAVVEEEKKEETLEFDVVVVGVGAAGCAAAIEAHRAGARVCIAEKMPEDQAGGNTRVSGAIWFDNTDRDRAAEYLRNLSGVFELSEEHVQTWARETAANTQWVESLGGDVGFDPKRPEYAETEGSDSYGGYRFVNPSWGMSHLFNLLRATVERLGIPVFYSSPALRLIQDEHGAVCGIESPVRDLIARGGVVLACGGFENNLDMVRTYLGRERTLPWGSPANTGDGIRMAQEVGADLWHMTSHYPFLGFLPPEGGNGVSLELLHTRRFLFVGFDGRRFCNETVPRGHGHAKQYGRYEVFPREAMYIVFDDEARRAGPLSARATDVPVGWRRLMLQEAWSEDNLAEVEKGWIVRADTISELAGLIGIDESVLEDTVSRYNESCRDGEDPQFGRSAHTLIALGPGPYYAIRSEPIVTYTCGGPKRDHHAQVLRVDGSVLDGLYAAGEISASYGHRMDAGMMIADALAFGRVAGGRAAARASTVPSVA